MSIIIVSTTPITLRFVDDVAVICFHVSYTVPVQILKTDTYGYMKDTLKAVEYSFTLYRYNSMIIVSGCYTQLVTGR